MILLILIFFEKTHPNICVVLALSVAGIL